MKENAPAFSFCISGGINNSLFCFVFVNLIDKYDLSVILYCNML